MHTLTEHTAKIDVVDGQARFHLPLDESIDILFSLRLLGVAGPGKYYIFNSLRLLHSGHYRDDSDLPYEFNCYKILQMPVPASVFVIFRLPPLLGHKKRVSVAFNTLRLESDAQRELLLCAAFDILPLAAVAAPYPDSSGPPE